MLRNMFVHMLLLQIYHQRVSWGSLLTTTPPHIAASVLQENITLLHRPETSSGQDAPWGKGLFTNIDTQTPRLTTFLTEVTPPLPLSPSTGAPGSFNSRSQTNRHRWEYLCPQKPQHTDPEGARAGLDSVQMCGECTKRENVGEGNVAKH